jgi:hypothetical protein
MHSDNGESNSFRQEFSCILACHGGKSKIDPQFVLLDTHFRQEQYLNNSFNNRQRGLAHGSESRLGAIFPTEERMENHQGGTL